MDKLGQSVINFFKYILNFFPSSPVQSVLAALNGSQFATWLSWLNWFVPIGVFLGISEAWLVGIGIYYLMQLVLRWIKAIE